MPESLDPDEEMLFANSACTNKFWTDSIDAEEAQLIRAEMARRKREYKEAQRQLSQRKFFGRSGPQKIIQAGTVYPCENIRARSVARFQRWLAGLRLKDPQQHESIVNWLRGEELGAEKERHRQEAILREQERLRIEQEERRRKFAAMTASISFEPIRANEQPQMDNEAKQRDRHELGYREHDYEGDRRRAEANEQARQARQEASRASGPTCVFCNQPGIASTASGWMCGLHAQGLL